ncbi:hypothetical protein Lal_00028217 [Lupinus albus]|nr:hypothetical protein Lal_00028217 [Lupinus albus]
MLTNHQKEKISQMEGLSQSVKRNRSIESDVVIGVLDTSVWPESDSFKDEGFGPVPKNWKGSCAGGKNFTCNKKIIGARYYIEDTAIDLDGHGSHTTSTAAGNYVHRASFFGLAKGTARGGVPFARIAAYKVCTELGCDSSAILSAFDDAIADGVSINSISIGSSYQYFFEEDPIAIGSFHAMAGGILAVNSAEQSSGSRSSEPFLAQARKSRLLKISDLTLSLKRESHSVNGPQIAISCPGETTLAQARILQYIPGFHTPRRDNSRSGETTLAQARQLSLKRKSFSIAQDFTLPEIHHTSLLHRLSQSLLHRLSQSLLHQLSQSLLHRLSQSFLHRLSQSLLHRLSSLELNLATSLEPKLATSLEPKLATSLELKLATLLELKFATLLEPRFATLLKPKFSTLHEPKFATLLEPKFATSL